MYPSHIKQNHFRKDLYLGGHIFFPLNSSRFPFYPDNVGKMKYIIGMNCDMQIEQIKSQNLLPSHQKRESLMKLEAGMSTNDSG